MEKQQSGTPGAGPSHPAAGVPMWRGDLTAHEQAEQQAAERAALIQFGRNSVSHLKPKPMMAHVDVDCLTDDELAHVRRMVARWSLTPSAVDSPIGKFMGELARALKQVEDHRAFVLMQFIYGAEVPPNWETAVATLPEEDGE